MKHDLNAHHQIMAAYGLFMVIWNVFENVLEVLIQREAKLDPVHGIIITSGLGFERKASIARSLLSLRGCTDPIGTINKICQTASRNALVHGMIFVGRDNLEFVKRDTDQSLKVRAKKFDRSGLPILVTDITALVAQLQVELGISDQDLDDFGNTTKSLANKSATSPSAPSSNKTL